MTVSELQELLAAQKPTTEVLIGTYPLELGDLRFRVVPDPPRQECDELVIRITLERGAACGSRV